MPLHLPRRRFWRFLIYLVALVLVLLAIDLLLIEWRRQITPGFFTTRIVEPTLPDGSIDYLTAVEQRFGDGVTPENNAAVLLLRAFGPAALPKYAPEDGITNRMGMPHLPADGDYFVTYDAYCRQHSIARGEQEDDPAVTDELSTVKVSTATADWIRQNDRALALVAEASRRPRFFIPFNGGYRPETMLEIGLPHVLFMR